VPETCRLYLEQIGARFDKDEVPTAAVPSPKPLQKDKRQALEIFLRIFNRNSGATDNVAKMKLGGRYSVFRKDVLPVLLKHNVVRPTEYYGGGQQERWELNYPLEVFLRAEDPDAPVLANLKACWDDLRG